MAATIEITALKQFNYEGPTDSVIISIKTKNNFDVAKLESGVTFTPTRGLMDVTALADNPIV